MYFKKKVFLLVSFIFYFFLFSPLWSAPPERPKPELLFLENDSMKIGIDKSMGASITWLSWKMQQENTVNIHDPGRLIQQSYYAGASLDRKADGQSKSWSPWTWNPIQGGGVSSWAKVTKFEKIDNKALLSETIPKLWDMPNEEAEATMFQKTEFEPNMPNVVTIFNRFISKRKENDRWGQAVSRHQELPALYFTSQFRHIETYLGKGNWRREEQASGPPWGKTTPPLNVMACFNDIGQGIAVFSPVADRHWNFGPHRTFSPKATSTDGPCVHIAPIGSVMLGPTTTLEYRYWMIVGSKEEITKRVDELIQKYPNETIAVINKSQLMKNLEAEKKQTVVAYGTSLTEKGAWVNQMKSTLNQKFPNKLTVINAGGSGQNSNWGLANLQTLVIDKKPDTVFIEFSINDAVERFALTVPKARQNLISMINAIQKNNPSVEIILMTMTPGEAFPVGHQSHRKNIEAYYEMYREVAKNRNLLLIDHYKTWKKLQISDAKLFEKYIPDSVHPTEEACKILITPAILKAIGFAKESQ